MVRNALLIIAFTMSITHLGAKTPNDFSPVSQVITQALGDSVSSLVLNSDSIVGTVTTWENDTLPKKRLCSNLCSVIKYTLCQPSMYMSDKRVYASFYADARLTFFSEGKNLTLELDYSIYKWRLVDGNGKQICRYDLPNQELLPLLHMIWPESKIINIKYDKFIKSYEK